MQDEKLKKMKADIPSLLVFVFKVILGVTFIWASYPKIQNPAEFAKIIHGYDLFPAFSINLIAIIVPFIELLVGFSLIMRLFPQSAVLIINGLLSVFIILIVFNLIRGHEYTCGCFSVAGQSGATSALILLVRDLVLLSMGVYVWKKTAKASG
jgi:putative oxidoreductase